MTKKKNKKKPNVQIKFAVGIPEKDLIWLMKLDAAEALRGMCSTIKEIKKEGSVPQGFFDDLDLFTNVLMNMADIATVVQAEWGEALKNYVKEGRLPSDELPALKQKKAEKKPSKKPSLSQKEKETVARLRKKGFTIKDIGKELHRAEKVVSDYVHLMEKKTKKRK